MNFAVKKGHEPKHRIDEIVWYIDEKTKTAQSAKVFYINFCLVKDGHQLRLINPNYVLRKDSGAAVDGVFFDEDLYTREIEASKMAQWCSVKNITPQEWEKAIGGRDITKCELLPCCGSISGVRELLHECRKEGGLMWRDVLQIEDYFSHCDYPQDEKGNRPKILDKILKRLGLLIKCRAKN
ncbi:MAG: hypothetical protein AAB575_04520 [Patescibacteria group bacterium]